MLLPKNTVLDVTTTSVGRILLEECYRSFFEHIEFDGKFHFFIHFDPSYGVSDEEQREAIRFVRALPDVDSRVQEVTVEVQTRNVGLQRSILTLFSHCFAPFGIHLEDDWRFFANLDLNHLLLDLQEQNSALIGFNNDHVSARGTFTRTNEVEIVDGSRVPLLRLLPPSWACDYLPLAPHIHQARRWIPIYTKALMSMDEPNRCPDERVRNYVREHGLRTEANMLWTRDVVVEDIGRAWAAARGQIKQIGADQAREILTPHVELVNGTPVITRSKALLAEAERRIPGVTQTFMKRPTQFAPGFYPIYADRGSGPFLVDVDGNCYLDFIAGLGAASVGYGSPLITDAVVQHVTQGTLLSLPTKLELEVARLLELVIPGAEQARFFKTGADACSAAVRVARYVTSRDEIASTGYHGWHDLFTVGSPGVPKSLSELVNFFDPFDEGGECSLERLLERRGPLLACVIIALPYERIMNSARMERIAELTRSHGALLVFDEIVTAFRIALGGAQEMFGVKADLVCLSKALAGGMPLSALCGPKSIMSAIEPLHVSTTFGGDTLALSSAVNVLNYYRTTDYVDRIALLGRRLRDGSNSIARELGMQEFVVGYDPLPVLRFSSNIDIHNRRVEPFLAAMARRGVLMQRNVNFITGAHSDQHIDFFLEVVREALTQLDEKPS